MIKPVGIDHIVLRTANLADMLRFYIDVLGCKIERELDIGLTQLRAGSALIDIVAVDSELGRLGGGEPTQSDNNLDHFCLQIASFKEAELIQFLQYYNIEVADFAERYGAEGFSRTLYIKDPDGNIVELKAKKRTI